MATARVNSQPGTVTNLQVNAGGACLGSTSANSPKRIALNAVHGMLFLDDLRDSHLRLQWAE